MLPVGIGVDEACYRINHCLIIFKNCFKLVTVIELLTLLSLFFLFNILLMIVEIGLENLFLSFFWELRDEHFLIFLIDCRDLEVRFLLGTQDNN